VENIRFTVIDYGIGICMKMNDLGLEEAGHAVLELVKGNSLPIHGSTQGKVYVSLPEFLMYFPSHRKTCRFPGFRTATGLKFPILTAGEVSAWALTRLSSLLGYVTSSNRITKTYDPFKARRL
jgi:hypothetical protein